MHSIRTKFIFIHIDHTLKQWVNGSGPLAPLSWSHLLPFFPPLTSPTSYQTTLDCLPAPPLAPGCFSLGRSLAKKVPYPSCWLSSWIFKSHIIFDFFWETSQASPMLVQVSSQCYTNTTYACLGLYLPDFIQALRLRVGFPQGCNLLRAVWPPIFLCVHWAEHNVWHIINVQHISESTDRWMNEQILNLSILVTLS